MRLKIERVSQREILVYLRQFYTSLHDYTYTCEKYNILDVDFKKMYNACDDWEKTKINKAKKSISLPRIVKFDLLKKYKEVHNIHMHTRVMPWEVCEVGNKLQLITEERSKIGSTLPLGVVFLDTIWEGGKRFTWGVQEFIPFFNFMT